MRGPQVQGNGQKAVVIVNDPTWVEGVIPSPAACPDLLGCFLVHPYPHVLTATACLR